MNEPTPTTDPLRPSSNGHGGHGPLAPPPGLTDLPPVEAPSAGFIVQLFVIPAVVVLVVIGVWLLFGKLAGGERDAMEYVRLIRNAGSNSRAANRAAYELASLLQNDPKLATDPRLLGELTDVLDQQLDQVEEPELTSYVALAIGRFQTLDAVASGSRKVEPLATLARATGSKYPNNVRLAAEASLAKQAARLDGKLDDETAVAALEAAGKSAEATEREMAAYALGFFGGDHARQILHERLGDENRYVRYNAAVALARRGDPAAADTLREMLTPADIEKVVLVESPAEKAAKVEAIELEALNALLTAVKDGHPELARTLRPQLDRLGASGLVSVRNAARAVLQSLPAAG